MAGALLSTGHQDAVRSPLEGSQDVENVQLAGAGQPDDLDVGRVLKAHRPCQVGGSVGAVVATEGQDLWFELTHFHPLFANSARSL